MKEIQIMRKLIALLFIQLILVPCLMAATSDPWDGSTWSVLAPDIDQPIGNSYKEIYDLRKGIAIRINKEHETLNVSSAGGVHKQGSARAFFQDGAPTTQIDGTAWDSGDTGSFWFDTNATPDNLFYVLTNHASTGTWTLVSTSLAAEMVAAQHTWADTQTFGVSATFTGGLTANGNITLGAGDDLIGSSTSDITINTNKFTVVGATGNTVIAGTLAVTGATTVTGLITANNGVTLGAGDDLIGSSTSDIIFNTNKFTVAGATGNTLVAGTFDATGDVKVNTNKFTVAAATGNTVVAGTLGVTGASTFTAGITANGGVTLGVGDDLIGSATSDITINTNKFTVAGATGNTVVAGTLGVTGAITATALITANAGVTLGAGDDLIGSATSDITFNTNKFTVAGASGNTLVGGTLDVVGNLDPTAFETTRGGFIDEDSMATDSAVKAPSQQSVKAYVDAEIASNTTMVPAVSGAGTGYAGEESVTLANGRIQKMGSTAYTGSPQTITFGAAFPTAIVTVVAIAKNTATTTGQTVTSFDVNGFSVIIGANAPDNWNWIAVGY